MRNSSPCGRWRATAISRTPTVRRSRMECTDGPEQGERPCGIQSPASWQALWCGTLSFSARARRRRRLLPGAMTVTVINAAVARAAAARSTRRPITPILQRHMPGNPNFVDPVHARCRRRAGRQFSVFGRGEGRHRARPSAAGGCVLCAGWARPGCNTTPRASNTSAAPIHRAAPFQ